MNFSYFSDKQKALILLFGLVILLLIFVLSMVSLSDKGSVLKAQLEQEKVIYSSLLKLQSKVFYLKLSSAKSKSIIQATYRKAKNKNIYIQSNNRIILSSSSIRFFNLLNGLNTLKNKHNIVAVDADIKSVGDGVVDVKMTFVHP